MTRTMLQHSGDSQPALPHLTLRARQRGASEGALLLKNPFAAAGAGER